jgi:hypothetical protein
MIGNEGNVAYKYENVAAATVCEWHGASRYERYYLSSEGESNDFDQRR